MSQTELYTRIKNKYDSQSNWESNNIKLERGELGIIMTPDGRALAKVGNGSSEYSNLPFVTIPYNMKVVTISATTTILVTNYNNILFCTNTSQITLTLPSASVASNGWSCSVHINSGAANVVVTSGSNPMILYGTTQSNNSITLGAPNFVDFITDGTNWHVVPRMLQTS